MSPRNAALCCLEGILLLKQIASMLVISWFFLSPPARSQTLVYSLTYAETRASFHAHFANASPFPGRRSDDENLSMLRSTRKTEIYSLSLATGKSTLLFSDEGPHLEIKATGAVSSDHKAYYAGIWRERRTTPSVMVTSEEAIYELSLDATNKFRKVADAQPNQPPAILNPQSSRAAFESFKEDKYVVSIYSIPEWKLLVEAADDVDKRLAVIRIIRSITPEVNINAPPAQLSIQIPERQKVVGAIKDVNRLSPVGDGLDDVQLIQQPPAGGDFR